MFSLGHLGPCPCGPPRKQNKNKKDKNHLRMPPGGEVGVENDRSIHLRPDVCYLLLFKLLCFGSMFGFICISKAVANDDAEGIVGSLY